MSNYIKTTILVLGASQNFEITTKEKTYQIFSLFFPRDNWAEKEVSLPSLVQVLQSKLAWGPLLWSN